MYSHSIANSGVYYEGSFPVRELRSHMPQSTARKKLGVTAGVFLVMWVLVRIQVQVY